MLNIIKYICVFDNFLSVSITYGVAVFVILDEEADRCKLIEQKVPRDVVVK